MLLFLLEMIVRCVFMTNVSELKEFATKIRIETIKEIATLGVGHIGGALSICDVLAVLYGGVMNVDPKNPCDENRDWLVVSKGHSGPALYATLALKGFFPMETLKTLNKPDTILPSHCDRHAPGVDMTTGSLGQGSSLAMGIALGNKMSGKSNYTYLLLGDGECNEGQVWEAVMFANSKKLNNLIAFVDDNKQQLDGFTKDISNMEDFAAKFSAFGWYAQSIDGHDVEAISNAIKNAKENKNGPSVIVLNTIKAKGFKKWEGVQGNHNFNITMEDALQFEKDILADEQAGK